MQESEGQPRCANAPCFLIRIGRAIFAAASWLIVAIGVAWAFGALWFDFPADRYRHAAAWLWLALAAAAWIFVRPRWRANLGIAIGVVCVITWWLSLQPRQFRDWKDEVALLPHAEIDGSVVTIHNVRNFDYRSVTDFDANYELRRLDLDKLRDADVFINYWGSPYMAHPIVSFDFGDEGRICFSIETRQEKGEGYSALGGLYRRFELFYVVADERDVIRVRTNHREGEDVYLYRLAAPHVREAFLEYIRTINELHERPRWYNAVTNNCTTAIRHQRASSSRSKWDWRMLVNGFGDELLYERRAIDTSLPFAELKRISHINERARAADRDPEFSERIRDGLPGMDVEN